jgi:hydroxymethylbilane synthase
LDGDQIHLRAEILSPDGREVQSCDTSFPANDHEAPLALARGLLDRASPPLRALFHG